MNVNFNNDGLVPAVIQDAITNKVLMLGYMNQESLEVTLKEKRVCFYSRSKKRLWIKGETSGNYLHLVDIKEDCDCDALLVKVKPAGPCCHTGSDTCWKEKNRKTSIEFLNYLESIIETRVKQGGGESYVKRLNEKGINKIVQKVGEEAVELVIEALNDKDDRFLNEAADLLFHKLILLNAKGFRLGDVVKVLETRH